MAQITITIPDEILQRVLDGIAGQHGYQTMIEQPEGEPIPNPETKAQFAKRMMINWALQSIMAWESLQASEVARLAAITDAEQDIQLS